MAGFDWERLDWSSLGRGWLDDLRVAAIVFTRIPIRFDRPIGPREVAQALRAAPVIGLGVGLAGAAVLGIANLFGLSPLLAALAALAAAIVATGGFHEDGLADFADGFGGRDKDARLAIMRDSRVGSYGVLALILSVGLRAGALAQLAAPWPAALAFIAAAAASRGMAPLLASMLPAARADGLGALLAEPNQEATLTAVALGAVLTLPLLGMGGGIAALALALAAVIGVAALARARLGGYTGDVLGAAQQAAEVAVLFAAAIFA